MPRSFDSSAESPASVEQVLSAFSDDHYWRARLAGSGGGNATLDSLMVDADGTVIVTTTYSLLRDRLPRLITQLHRGDLAMVQTETWSRIVGNRMRGEISVAVPGAPFSVLSKVLVTPASGGSQMTYTTTVEAKIPLVGGAIESFLAGQIADQIDATHRFTTAWIIEKG